MSVVPPLGGFNQIRYSKISSISAKLSIGLNSLMSPTPAPRRLMGGPPLNDSPSAASMTSRSPSSLPSSDLRRKSDQRVHDVPRDFEEVPLVFQGTSARRAPLSIATCKGSASERTDLMFPCIHARSSALRGAISERHFHSPGWNTSASISALDSVRRSANRRDTRTMSCQFSLRMRLAVWSRSGVPFPLSR